MHSLYGVVRPVEGAKLATLVELRLKPGVFQQLSKSGARLVELVFDNGADAFALGRCRATKA